MREDETKLNKAGLVFDAPIIWDGMPTKQELDIINKVCTGIIKGVNREQGINISIFECAEPKVICSILAPDYTVQPRILYGVEYEEDFAGKIHQVPCKQGDDDKNV